MTSLFSTTTVISWPPRVTSLTCGSAPSATPHAQTFSPGHRRTGRCRNGPVELVAAGQAPGPADHHGIAAADPEPGGALPAMDAELDGYHARHPLLPRGFCAVMPRAPCQ